MRVSLSIAAALLPIVQLVAAEHAEPAAGDDKKPAQASFTPSNVKGVFVEQFDDGWEDRWVVSKGKIDDADTGTYAQGIWKVEEPTHNLAIKGDKGLVLKSESRRHAISALLPEPLDNTGERLVVQYEVKPQQEVECGGSYLKLLRQDDGFKPALFTGLSPYVIMFGPDRCGNNGKVHFIINRKSRETGEYVEHHLAKPTTARLGKQTYLYRLVVNPDQTYEIAVNGEEIAAGSLLTDFVPSINPPETIADPDDVKPADWVEEPMIADPAASKPADWDESEPATIEDPDASRPDGWLEDEPSVIADPDVAKPADWDDDDDGEWTAPTVPNPKCEAAGCGKWVHPKVPNPKYKGKWVHPMIANPEYKGPWAPQNIPNPNHEKYLDPTPANLEPIGAIGFELWVIQADTVFDNIYIGRSVDEADKLKRETFDVKRQYEDEVVRLARADEPVPEDQDSSVVDVVRQQVLAFVEAAKDDPIGAVQAMPVVASGLGACAATVLLLLASVLRGGAAPADVKAADKAAVSQKTAEDKATTAKASGVDAGDDAAGSVKKR